MSGSESDVDYSFLLSGYDESKSKASAYDIAFDAFVVYADFIKCAKHQYLSLMNFTGQLICNVVEIFNESNQNDYITNILIYAYGDKHKKSDQLMFCAAIEYVGIKLHEERSRVETGPPLKSKFIVDAYIEKVKLAKQQLICPPPKDPRLAQVIPGVIRVASASTFLPMPVSHSQSQNFQIVKTPEKRMINEAVSMSGMMPSTSFSNPINAPVPLTNPCFEVNTSSNVNVWSSRTFKRSPITPSVPMLKRPRSGVIEVKQFAFDYRNDNWDALEMFVDRPEFKRCLYDFVFVDKPLDIKSIATNYSVRIFTSIDSYCCKQWPAVITSREWLEKSEAAKLKALTLYSCELRKCDQTLPLLQRINVALISDFGLEAKRSLLPFCATMNIDFPYHWRFLNCGFSNFAHLNRILKSFVICVGLEFCTRYDDYDSSERELIAFYNDFFAIYQSNFMNSYKVFQNNNNVNVEITSAPPAIIILTVPVIQNGQRFPTEYVRQLNERIRWIVNEKKPQIPMIELYDWAKESEDLSGFSLNNVHKRFMRLCVALNEYNFFDQVKRNTDHRRP